VALQGQAAISFVSLISVLSFHAWDDWTFVSRRDARELRVESMLAAELEPVQQIGQ
jgi:hypothetical protein